MPLDGQNSSLMGSGVSNGRYRRGSTSGIPDNVKKLLQDGDKLFSAKRPLDSFYQHVAEHFYPEMADFTSPRYLGEEFAQDKTTSYPFIARRSLGDAFSALLRPTSLDTTSPGVWFDIVADDRFSKDVEAKRWLEYATGVQRRAMYDWKSGFVKATKLADHQFATFGQAVIQIGVDVRKGKLRYQTWHLRDVVWCENDDGQIDHVQRKWEPTVTQLVSKFGDRCSPKVLEKVSEAPYATVQCRHIVVDIEAYDNRGLDGAAFKRPWISIWVDVDNQFVMEERDTDSRIYVIPRWVTMPGCQYASSPSVTAALPDARLLQAMTLTILEASEKFGNPPMAATQQAIRSDMQLYAGGITWIDAEYDERQGEALRPIYQPTTGQSLNPALTMRADTRDMIAKAFFLDSLSLPPADVRAMTAYEVGQRMSEWIRRAMPIFEPVEFEYNAVLCEETFGLLMRNGGFGPVSDIPPQLQGSDIEFKFSSPLHDAQDKERAQKFMEAKAALVEATQLDPSVASMINPTETLRDVLMSIGVPSTWIRSEGEMAEFIKQTQMDAMAQKLLQGGQAASQIAKNLGDASNAFTSSVNSGEVPE